MQPLLIAVEENETVLDDTPEKMGLENVVHFLNPCCTPPAIPAGTMICLCLDSTVSKHVESLHYVLVVATRVSYHAALLLQVRVANYWEALGVIAAHKAGVDPRALRRNGVNHLHRIETPTHAADSLNSLKKLEQTPIAMTGVC